jgi:hypothetical protein
MLLSDHTSSGVLWGLAALLFYPLVLIVKLIVYFTCRSGREKPSPDVQRLAVAYFLFIPIFGVLSLYACTKFYFGSTHLGILFVCLFMTGLLCIFASLWAELISIRISCLLAGVTWLVFIYLAFYTNFFAFHFSKN